MNDDMQLPTVEEWNQAEQIAEKYHAVRVVLDLLKKLLDNNLAMAVAAMASSMETWQLRMEKRLEVFDRNHTRAQSKQHDRLQDAEKRIEDAAKYVQKLTARIKTLEAKVAALKPEEAKT